jgi:hypothetical protein
MHAGATGTPAELARAPARRCDFDDVGFEILVPFAQKSGRLWFFELIRRSKFNE